MGAQRTPEDDTTLLGRHRKQLPIPHMITPIRWREPTGEIGTGL